MSTRKDEEQYLHKTIAAFPGFSGPFSYSDVIEAVVGVDSPLSLEMIGKETVKHVDNSVIKKINENIGYLTKIIEKPRTFIKSTEEKVPIDRAKRINYHAIAELSRDSNDWYSRSIISVKPKQIHAEVTEDTFDIYENIFVVTLFDLIYKIINAEYNDCILKIQNAGSALAHDYVSKLYTGYNPNWNFSDVCFGNTINYDSKYRESLEKLKTALEKLLRRVAILRTSDLYRSLRNKKRITGNVQRTNILMFDYNYNRAYKLWLYLHENNYDEQIKVDYEEIPQELLSHDYHLYCFLCLCACLDKIGVVCTQSPTFTFDLKGLHANKNTIFSYGEHNLELELKDNNFIFRYRVENKKKEEEKVKVNVHHLNFKNELETTDEFWFCPAYDNLDKMSQAELFEYTSNLFNDLTTKKPDEEITGRYAMRSLNLDRQCENNLDELLCRRLLNSGDNLSDEESKKDLEHWSNYKTGIVLASAYPFRGSPGLYMISKVLYNHLLKPKLMVKGMEKCPICSGKLLNRGIDRICPKCNICISHTYCKSCDPKKENPFFWIKYKDDSILDKKDKMKYCETTPLRKIDFINHFMPICALTSFDVDIIRIGTNDKKYKFRTICPRCGIKLGEENSSE